MVTSIDPDPEAHHHFPLHKQHTPLFKKGDAVEVSTDEEGFGGAWFPATILDCSAPKKKKKKTVLVRYETFVKEDGRTPLTESVDPAFVRPFPPGGVRPKFEVNDVVDAYFKDAWWCGVVRKVLQGKSYRVLFDNPLDFIDCPGADLRLHWDWVFGKWVRPNKPPSGGEDIFSSGADVEVNLEKEVVGDTWFPAVVIKQNEGLTFSVKCQCLNNDEAVPAPKEDIVVVDSLHIRPSPPRHSRTDYELLDHVDALIDGRWKKGLITKVLAGGKYIVFFQQQKEDKEFTFSELRPHIEWDNGKWKSRFDAESKGLVVAPRNTEKLDSGDTTADGLQLAVLSVRPGASYDNIKQKTPSTSAKRIMMDDSTISVEKSDSNVFSLSNKKMKVISDVSGKQLSHSDNLMEGDAGEARTSATRKNATSPAQDEETLRDLVISKKRKQANLVNLDLQKAPMASSIGRHAKSPVGSSLVSVTDKESSQESGLVTCAKKGEGVPKEDGVPVILGLGAVRISQSSNSGQHRAGDKLNTLGDKKRGSESSGERSLQKSAGTEGRKRGRPRKYCDINAKMDAGSVSLETSCTDSDGKKMIVKVAPDEVGQLQLDLESAVPQIELVEKSAVVSGIVNAVNEADTLVVGMIEGVAEEDQPLSLWCGGFSPISAHEDRLSSPSVNGCHDRKKRQSDLTTNSSSVSTSSDALLFVKKSPVWATLESMEIFQNLPQRPHFLPLRNCEEKYREGGAIGIMVTFANLFEEIASLTIYDSRSTFESTLNSLSDFEKHGFDVSVPRGRINKLLSIRNPHMEWLNEAKNAERELHQHVGEKEKLEGSVKELEEKILALQQSLAVAKAEMEAKVARTTVVQAHVDKMKSRIGYARSEFERVANSPWRLA